MKKHYNKNYFNTKFWYLEDNDNYLIRSKAAQKRYFKNINLKNKKILEYGCGYGKNIYGLPNAEGFDISKNALRFCKKKGINTTTKPKKNFYDVVLCAHVLEHVPDPVSTLKIIRTYLKKKGMLIISIPKEEHKTIDSFEVDINNHLYSWNFNSIKKLLIYCKYKVIEIEKSRASLFYKKLNFFYKNYFDITYRITHNLSRIYQWDRYSLRIVCKK